MPRPAGSDVKADDHDSSSEEEVEEPSIVKGKVQLLSDLVTIVEPRYWYSEEDMAKEDGNDDELDGYLSRLMRKKEGIALVNAHLEFEIARVKNKIERLHVKEMVVELLQSKGYGKGEGKGEEGGRKGSDVDMEVDGGKGKGLNTGRPCYSSGVNTGGGGSSGVNPGGLFGTAFKGGKNERNPLAVPVRGDQC